MSFQKEIILWYAINKRDLPWRNSQDPYVIWLSEVILQQTRVEQGLPYFEKFLAHYPSVRDFAAASQDEILKHWQGLGYYSRGRNMWITAQEVSNSYGGNFPKTYQELIKLKGIGDYTASAIASFSSNENKAVLDGNVFRVLARYFGISEAINSTSGKKIFSALAQELIEGQEAEIYNQAIMEFGALQCKPKAPNCQNCVLNQSCSAFQQGIVAELPIKIKAAKAKPRYFNYFLLQQDEKIPNHKSSVGYSSPSQDISTSPEKFKGFREYVYGKQRQAGDIWQGLYDFPLLETKASYQDDLLNFQEQLHLSFGKQVIIRHLYTIKQVLSHQIIYADFFVLENYMINFSIQDQIKLLSMRDFMKLGHPKLIANFLEMYQSN